MVPPISPTDLQPHSSVRGGRLPGHDTRRSGHSCAHAGRCKLRRQIRGAGGIVSTCNRSRCIVPQHRRLTCWTFSGRKGCTGTGHACAAGAAQLLALLTTWRYGNALQQQPSEKSAHRYQGSTPRCEVRSASLSLQAPRMLPRSSRVAHACARRNCAQSRKAQCSGAVLLPCRLNGQRLGNAQAREILQTCCGPM